MRTPRIYNVTMLLFCISAPAIAQVDLDMDFARGGHASGIVSVSFSPNASKVATGSHDYTVKRWSLATGEMVDTVGVHDTVVTDVAWSPAGTKIASSDVSGIVRIWELGGGPGSIIPTGEPVHSIAYSTDAQSIYVGGEADRGQVIENGAVVAELTGQTGAIVDLAVSPDGSLLAAGCDDGRVLAWQTSDLTVAHSSVVHDFEVRGVAFSPDGTKLLSYDGAEVRVAHASSGLLYKEYDESTDRVVTADFRSNEEIVYSTWWGILRKRNITSDAVVAELETQGKISLLKASPDGQSFLAGYGTGHLFEHTSSDLGWTRTLTQGGSISTMAMSSDGSKICASKGGFVMEVLDAATGAVLADNVDYSVAGPTELADLFTYDMEFTSSGVAVVGACADGNLRFWRSTNGALLSAIPGTHGAATCVGVTSDDARVFSGSSTGSLHAFHSANGSPLFTTTAHDEHVTSLAVSPNDQLLATGGLDGRVKTWSAANGHLAFDLGSHVGGVRCVRFAPDGFWLASGGDDGKIHLWDAVGGIVIRTITTGFDKVAAVEFSPSSATLAASVGDGKLRFYDVATGDDVTGTATEASLISDLAWVGTTLAWGRDDGSLVVATEAP